MSETVAKRANARSVAFCSRIIDAPFAVAFGTALVNQAVLTLGIATGYFSVDAMWAVFFHVAWARTCACSANRSRNFALAVAFWTADFVISFALTTRTFHPNASVFGLL